MPDASLIRESGCCLSICTFSLLSPAFPQSFLAFSIMDSADKSKYHFYSFCVIFTVYSLFIHIFYLLFNTLNLLHFLLRHLYQSKQKKTIIFLVFFYNSYFFKQKSVTQCSSLPNTPFQMQSKILHCIDIVCILNYNISRI